MNLHLAAILKFLLTLMNKVSSLRTFHDIIPSLNPVQPLPYTLVKKQLKNYLISKYWFEIFTFQNNLKYT